jgi:DNA-binding transcriptional ArsR family regulator
MTNNYIMLDVNDERASAVAEVLSNKTCKRVLSLLAEKEMSESEIAVKLEIPANTANYNVHKLIDAGLIEQTKGIFWSVKGKRVPTYRISNKKILISPKPMLKGILPAVIISGILTIGVKIFFSGSSVLQSSAGAETINYAAKASEGVMAAAPSATGIAAERIADTASQAASQTAILAGSSPEPWAWFLIGAWAALLIFVLMNMRRN